MKNILIAVLLASAVLFGLPLRAEAGWEGRANTAAALGALTLAAQYSAGVYNYPYAGYYGGYSYPSTYGNYGGYGGYGGYGNYGGYGYPSARVCPCSANYGNYGSTYGSQYGQYGMGYGYQQPSYGYSAYPYATSAAYSYNNYSPAVILYNESTTWNQPAQQVTQNANTWNYANSSVREVENLSRSYSTLGGGYTMGAAAEASTLGGAYRMDGQETLGGNYRFNEPTNPVTPSDPSMLGGGYRFGN